MTHDRGQASRRSPRCASNPSAISIASVSDTVAGGAEDRAGVRPGDQGNQPHGDADGDERDHTLLVGVSAGPRLHPVIGMNDRPLEAFEQYLSDHSASKWVRDLRLKAGEIHAAELYKIEKKAQEIAAHEVAVSGGASFYGAISSATGTWGLLWAFTARLRLPRPAAQV